MIDTYNIIGGRLKCINVDIVRENDHLYLSWTGVVPARGNNEVIIVRIPKLDLNLKTMEVTHDSVDIVKDGAVVDTIETAFEVLCHTDGCFYELITGYELLTNVELSFLHEHNLKLPSEFNK